MKFAKKREKRENQMVTDQQKLRCILWYHGQGTPKKIQVKFREKYERNEKAPGVKTIKSWSKKFKENGSWHKKAGKDLALLTVKLWSRNSKKTSNSQFGELQIVSE